MKTNREWILSLSAYHVGSLIDTREFGSAGMEERFSPNEILDLIVEYEGGIASGYEIRSLIEDIYGVQLRQ